MSLYLHEYMYWIELCLPQIYVPNPFPIPDIPDNPGDVTLFGNRVFADIIQVKMGSEEQRQVYKKEWYWYAERSQRINPNSIWIFDSNFPWAHTEHQQYFQAHLQ